MVEHTHSLMAYSQTDHSTGQTTRTSTSALTQDTPSLSRPPAGGGTDPGTSTRAQDRKVLLVELEKGSKLNTFQISQGLSRYGSVTRMLRLSEHRYEVVMSNDEATTKLLAATELTFKGRNKPSSSIPISVKLHPTKNSTRGVITCWDLEDASEEDIVAEMQEQGVTAARKITKKRDNQETSTGTIILSFNGSQLPEKVRVGWRSVPVRQYVPEPTRCFRCQRFGHVASSCRGSERCGKCSVVGHSAASCEATKLKCLGCGDEHESWSRSCPKFKAEKEKLRNRTPGAAASAPKKVPPTTPSRQSAPLPSSNPTSRIGQTPMSYRDALDSTRSDPATVPSIDSKIGSFMNMPLREFLSLMTDLLPKAVANPQCRPSYKDESTQTEPSTADAAVNTSHAAKPTTKETSVSTSIDEQTQNTDEQQSQPTATSKRARTDAGPVSPHTPVLTAQDQNISNPGDVDTPNTEQQTNTEMNSSETEKNIEANSSETALMPPPGNVNTTNKGVQNKKRKLDPPSPNRNTTIKETEKAQNKQQSMKTPEVNKKDYTFLTSKGMQLKIPRVSTKQYHRHGPLEHTRSMENLGATQRDMRNSTEVWQDRQWPTHTDDGQPPRVRDAYMAPNPAFARRSPPRARTTSHPSDRCWDSRAAWKEPELYDGRCWEA